MPAPARSSWRSWAVRSTSGCRWIGRRPMEQWPRSRRRWAPAFRSSRRSIAAGVGGARRARFLTSTAAQRSESFSRWATSCEARMRCCARSWHAPTTMGTSFSMMARGNNKEYAKADTSLSPTNSSRWQTEPSTTTARSPLRWCSSTWCCARCCCACSTTAPPSRSRSATVTSAPVGGRGALWRPRSACSASGVACARRCW
mmetsp:Transcript_137328/g.383102  ORF Transcript_137328/g.383102 Transcript_137328/m.383102 type:complete len:201 (-) Transcript_137328:121-723(-)